MPHALPRSISCNVTFIRNGQAGILSAGTNSSPRSLIHMPLNPSNSTYSLTTHVIQFATWQDISVEYLGLRRHSFNTNISPENF
jgi:hypothetical protein